MIKNILILANGNRTGELLIHEALSSAYNVTMLNSGSSSINLLHPNLEILKGSVFSYGDVKAAIAGQDAVIWAVEGEKASATTAGTQNVILAMQEMNVRKLICLSCIGAGSTTTRMGLGFQLITRLKGSNALWEAKGEQEKMLNHSHLDFVVVQVGEMTDRSASTEHLHVLTPSEIKRNFFTHPGRISRTVVVQFIIAQLASDAWVGHTVSLFT